MVATPRSRTRHTLVRVGLIAGLAALAFGVANSGLLRSSTPSVEVETPPQQERWDAVAQSSQEPFEPALPEPRLSVTYRLDPRVTRGLYLGERWVSPPEFRFVQPGSEYVVVARLQQIDPYGDRTDLNGQWAASDPEMVAISRDAPGQVTLVVRRPGESRVTVTSGTESKVLHIHARQTPEAMDVSIRQ